MCGRYTLLADEVAIRRRFHIEKPITHYEPSYNIAPTEDVLSVIYDPKRGERRAGFMKWGLVPFWAKDKKRASNMINARSETIHEKPSFKHLLMRKRCLVVADSFYEWEKDGQERIPHRIQTAQQSLFSFAGLWDMWQGDQGEKLFTCTLLTKDSNPFMENIHHRMPIILDEAGERDWLEGTFHSNEAVQQFAATYDVEDLTSYIVSSHVNHARHKDEKCILEV